ncbi:MAG: DUF362 domain-containing protein [bacterium]
MQAPETAALPAYRPLVASAWVPRGGEESRSCDLFRRMIEAATDFSWLSRGDRVLVKLALNSGNPFPATSDPWSLWCLLKVLSEKGAGEIWVGDQGGVEHVHWKQAEKKGSSRALCDSAGLLRILGESGAKPVFFEEGGYDAYLPALPSGTHHWQKPLWVSSLLKEVDHVVYLSRVSSHVLADITSGMKLAVGFLRDDSRAELHRSGESFYAMYEEIHRVPEIASRLRLAISSGRQVFTTLGPDRGHLAEPDFGLVFASEDLLAHELLAYAWLKWNRSGSSPVSKVTSGSLTRFRSPMNRIFVWWTWRGEPGPATQALPFWQAGDVWRHPAIANFISWKGGRPAEVSWLEVNAGPDESVASYLKTEIGI